MYKCERCSASVEIPGVGWSYKNIDDVHQHWWCDECSYHLRKEAGLGACIAAKCTYCHRWSSEMTSHWTFKFGTTICPDCQDMTTKEMALARLNSIGMQIMEISGLLTDQSIE